MKPVVSNAGLQSVNGNHHQTRHEVTPTGSAKVCNEQGWNSSKMWSKLNGLNAWYQHKENDSYIHLDKSDQNWWIDGPDGPGVHIISGTSDNPPKEGWKPIQNNLNDRSPPNVPLCSQCIGCISDSLKDLRSKLMEKHQMARLPCRIAKNLQNASNFLTKFVKKHFHMANPTNT